MPEDRGEELRLYDDDAADGALAEVACVQEYKC